ncbi:MAG: GIY-YIG nuclease family protein, partial [Phormidesmis sp.]
MVQMNALFGDELAFQSGSRLMSWQQWSSVPLSDRHLLPNEAGIYVVADKNHFVWYVGQAIDLQGRWLGRGHHRYPQLIRTNKKLEHR